MALRSLLTSTLAAQASAVWLAGVNIAGCEIGIDTSGNWAPNEFESQYGCPSADMAKTQMQHFADVDSFNVFRLPVPWQQLINNDIQTNKLDAAYFEKYNELVQICLDTSAEAHCIIDIHNYGRWAGKIVGQDGPSADALAATWTQIATHWASNSRVIFGIMNEPHDSDGATDFDMDKWAATSQTVVTAIRGAGATSQMIFLTPTNWANAMSFPDRSAALLGVKNPDGSTDNLIFELHQYFDKEGGKNTFCNDALADSFASLAEYLKTNQRQAFIGELGAGNGQDCVDIVCNVLDVLNNNADQFVGWTSWAAGNWWADYELTQVPTGGQDVGIVKECFAPKFKASKAA